MATLFSDNFDRADNATVDATNWQENPSGDWSIASNLLTNTLGGVSPRTCLTTTSAHAATTDVKVTITQVSTGDDSGVVVRWTAGTYEGTSNGYAVNVFPGASCNMYRHDSSASGTLLGSGTSITQVANGVIALEVSGTGATVTLKSYYQGVLKETVGDTSGSRITTAQRTGVYGCSTDSFNNFVVDDLIPVGSAVLTGTAIGGITEADVVAGGKVITVTLTSETFIA